jgi:glutathione S-transferase
VLERRLALVEYVAGEYTIADVAIWPWISRFEYQEIDFKRLSQRRLLVSSDRSPPSRAEGLSRHRAAACHPDAVSRGPTLAKPSESQPGRRQTF